MATENELMLAKKAYDALCTVLDGRGWTYERNDDSFAISIKINGDDLPMEFTIVCDVSYQIIMLRSWLPFKVAEDKRVECSIVTNQLNYSFASGGFDFSVANGDICFRLNTSFRNTMIQPSVIEYMIDIACSTIDAYNDKLLMLSKGVITLEALMNEILGE